MTPSEEREGVFEALTVAPATANLREVLDDAIRYWEVGRLFYNFVLLAVVLAWIGITWPAAREASILIIPWLFTLAIIANVLYCAAYIADVPLQYSSFATSWRRWRWVLWAIGTLLASNLASYLMYGLTYARAT